MNVCFDEEPRWRLIFVVVVAFAATVGLRHREPQIGGNIKAWFARVGRVFPFLFQHSPDANSEQCRDSFSTLACGEIQERAISHGIAVQVGEIYEPKMLELIRVIYAVGQRKFPEESTRPWIASQARWSSDKAASNASPSRVSYD